MGNEAIQIKSDEDGCTYIYSVVAGTCSKICDIASPKELLESVKEKLAAMQRSTEI
jgi:hypothetical protein